MSPRLSYSNVGCAAAREPVVSTRPDRTFAVRVSNWTVTQRLTALAAVAAIGPIALAVMAYRVVSTVKVSGPVYADIVRGKDLVADILPPPEYIIESYLVTLEAASEMRPEVRAEQVAYLKRLRADYDTRHDVWVKDLPEGEMRRTMLVDSYEPAMRFYQLVEREFVPAMESGDLAKATMLVKGPLVEAYQQHRAAIDKVVVLANAYAADAE